MMACAGSLAGLMAGLMGVGGGIVIVPGLYFILTYMGYSDDWVMHVAIGTSLATIIPTGLSSSYAHWRRGSVDFSILRQWVPGIVLGVGVGGYLAGLLDGLLLQRVFAVILVGVSVLMFFGRPDIALRKSLPNFTAMVMIGVCVGALSALMGIGGATLSVPIMILCSVAAHKAIGTASAIGVAIAIPGTLSFMLIGWNVPGLPPLSLGYVSVPAMLAIIPFSVAFAPLGARLAHYLPVGMLRKVFGGFLCLIALRMLWAAG